MLKLQAAIKYGEEDLVGAKSLVDQCAPDDPDTDINRGTVNFVLNGLAAECNLAFGRTAMQSAAEVNGLSNEAMKDKRREWSGQSVD